MSVIQSYCCKDSDYCLNYNALRGDFVSVESGEGLDADALDVEAGAAEDVEPHDELGAGGGVDDFAFESHEAARARLLRGRPGGGDVLRFLRVCRSCRG